MNSAKSSQVTLTLTSDEALVLFEFLHRFSSTQRLVIEDQAEERTLWDLCGMLEKSLLQPFDVQYKELLDQARRRLRDGA